MARIDKIVGGIADYSGHECSVGQGKMLEGTMSRLDEAVSRFIALEVAFGSVAERLIGPEPLAVAAQTEPLLSEGFAGRLEETADTLFGLTKRLQRIAERLESVI